MAITNNPAMDDSWSFSEQVFAGSFLFDVRANDAIKKPLHSIDNGQAADLATADLARSAAASSDRSALGATIWITSDGRIGYSAESISGLVDELGAGETLTDSFLYAVKQGSNIVWATVRITITGTNDAPVATADVATAGEDSLVTGSVATNDSDVDHGAVLQFAASGQPPAGFALASNGSWAFDGSNPAYQALGAGETIQLAIPYIVTDQHGATSSATLQLTVTGTNDAPTVSGTVLGTANENGALVALDALANAGDIDGNTTLSVINVPAAQDLPAGVTYDASTGRFSLDPGHPAYQQLANAQTTVVTVSYGVSDGTATTLASVSWTITGTNDAPVAVPAAAGVAEDQSVSGQLAATDPDSGASLTYATVGDVPAGFALASDGSWAFGANQTEYQALAEGEVRELAVSYSVTDEHGATGGAILELTITGTNDIPTVSGAVLGMAAEGAATVTLDALANASDVDGNTTLSVVNVPAAEELPAGVSYDPSTGKFALDPSHSIYQQLANGQATIVTVSYGVSDGIATTPASVSWTVTGTNDGPVASAVAASVAEDEAVSGQLAATDPDSGASLTYASVGDVPAGFALASDGSWMFDANQAEYQALAEGEDRELAVSYRVTDEHGATSLSILTLTVSGANDRPVATSTAAEVAEGDSVSGQLFALDHDSDAQLTFAVDGSLPEGFSLGADGSWTFDASHEAYEGLGVDEFQLVEIPFTVTDEHGETASSFLTIAVNGTNDAPAVDNQIANQTVDEDRPWSFSIPGDSFSDVDGDGLSYSATLGNGDPLPSWLSFDGATLTFSGMPPQDFNGTISLTVVASDGEFSASETFDLVVSSINDAPVLSGTATVLPNGTEDTAFSFTPQQLLAGWTDAEGGTLSVINLTADHGTVFTKADGSWFVHPSSDYNGPITLSYQVSDGVTSTATTLSLTIAPVNDAPRFAVGSTLPTQTEDTSFTLTKEQLLAAWTDPEGTPLTITSLTFSRGSVTANADGSYTFRPQADYFGSANISMTVSDGQLSRTQQVPLSIQPVADPARISGTSNGTVIENQYFNAAAVATATGNLNSIEPDNSADNDKWQAVATATASDGGYGSFTVTAAGQWTYSLNNGNPTVDALSTGQTLTDTFTVRTVDGTSQLVTIVINGRTDFMYVAPPAGGPDPNDFDGLNAEATQSWFVNVTGTAGNDVYDGSHLGDSIAGWGGSDLIYGHGGNDVLRGAAEYGHPNYAEPSPDTLYGQAGDDQLDGGLGADTLYGGSGNDTLRGESGTAGTSDVADQLYGGSGADFLYGNHGDDMLNGGLGSDQLFGGAGSDTFLYLTINDSGDGIWDYDLLLDTLDLSAIDANVDLEGDQAFGWGGNVPTANSLWMVQDASNMLLYGDTDGDATTAEFMLQLVNHASTSTVQPWDGFIL